MVWAYYNEIELYPAAWLRRLIARKLIAPGYVDERSIVDVRPDDLDGFGQRHFFAGLGAWSLALRWAGVSDDEPVWTGSCPCQSLSVAGQKLGFDDKRHLWPDWFWLISQRRPHLLFGEQVASPLGRSWLDLVFSDLEGTNHACGAAVLPAAGVGAPHERHRFFWVADAQRARPEGRPDLGRHFSRQQPASERSCAEERPNLADASELGWRTRRAGRSDSGDSGQQDKLGARRPESVAYTNGEPALRAAIPWEERDPWLVEPDVGRLASRRPEHVDQLRALGNSLVPEVAATFVKAYLEARNA